MRAVAVPKWPGAMTDLEHTTSHQRRAVAEVLNRVQVELKRLELWEQAPPAEERLSSDQPFSWDTLRFHQWLQWCFLPRMDEVLAGREAWPPSCAIHPYAEECLADRAADTQELLFLIETLDELVSGRTHAGTSAGTH